MTIWLSLGDGTASTANKEEATMVWDPVCMMEVDPREAAGMAEYQGRTYYFCSDECHEEFAKNPERFTDKAPGMRLTIGAMGSAGDDQPPAARHKAYALGQAIGRRGFVLITGACPGLPYECARGARDNGGPSVGISPALSLDEHVHKYQSPSDAFDVLIYTGSGLMGREVTNIHSSDMVVILGGRSGTLGEFAIAFDEGKLIGVLEGTGGITESISGIVESLDKDTGAKLIFESDPEALLSKLAAAYTESHYKRPSCFCDDTAAAG
jgi:uncharacterized protein (TIGR00725 family)